MAAFFMMGKYSAGSIKEISSGRTKKAVEVIEQNKGKVNSMYALLGGNDLVLITDFPGINEAMKASIALTKLSGIAFSTFPAVSVDEFDKMIG